MIQSRRPRTLSPLCSSLAVTLLPFLDQRLPANPVVGPIGAGVCEQDDPSRANLKTSDALLLGAAVLRNRAVHTADLAGTNIGGEGFAAIIEGFKSPPPPPPPPPGERQLSKEGTRPDQLYHVRLLGPSSLTSLSVDRTKVMRGGEVGQRTNFFDVMLAFVSQMGQDGSKSPPRAPKSSQYPLENTILGGFGEVCVSRTPANN